jgi:DSF synthase
MQKVKDLNNTITFQELADIGHVWADAALELTAKDIRMVDHLIARQTALS